VDFTTVWHEFAAGGSYAEHRHGKTNWGAQALQLSPGFADFGGQFLLDYEKNISAAPPGGQFLLDFL